MFTGIAAQPSLEPKQGPPIFMNISGLPSSLAPEALFPTGYHQKILRKNKQALGFSLFFHCFLLIFWVVGACRSPGGEPPAMPP